jgi:serine protease Do
VLSVVDGSPASKGGLQEGDIITSFDSVRLTSQSGELSELIGKKKPGDTVALVVYRDSKEVHLTITLGTQDSQ